MLHQHSDISAVSASQCHKQVTMNNPRLYFSRHKRLLSLDVFRGLCVFLMIFVNNIGSTWPVLNTSPWNGFQLGDVVQPLFLASVGISIVLSMNKYRKQAVRNGFIYAIKRFVKLFLIGLLTEGGGANIADYNLKYLRVFGVLQRIAICYIIGAMLELFLPPLFRFDIALTPTNSSLNLSPGKLLLSKQKRIEPHSQSKTLSPSIQYKEVEQDHSGWHRRFIQSFSVFRMYQYHWIIFVILLLMYCSVIYGLNTPNAYNQQCGNDNLYPACNAISYLDQRVLGQNHMYFPVNSNDISFQRMKDCSSCSPGKCPLTPDSNMAAWCNDTAFEPYGIVSTLPAMLTTMFGMHIGHLYTNFSERRVRIFHLLSVAFLQCIVGILLEMSTYNAWNASLYSVSYMFMSSGISSILFSVLYYIMDSKIFAYRFKTYGKYKRRKMAKRHLTNYYVSPLLNKNEKMDKLHQHIAATFIEDVIEENSEDLNDEQEEEDEEENKESHKDIIIISNKSSMVQSITDTDTTNKYVSSESTDIETCCPFWCCCCCEDLPCTRYDYSFFNIIDKLMFRALESLGRNAFLIYIFAQTNVSSWFLSIFYWSHTNQCLANIIWPTGVYYGPYHGNDATEWRYSKEIMLWTIVYCLFWTFLAYYLHHKKWYYVV